MPPVENEAPIPTPAPASTLADSNKENCGRCPMQPISQLVPIEEMVVDRAEDAPRVAKVESEVQRRHLTRLTVQDPTQASDEGDRGSLFNYVDSAANVVPPVLGMWDSEVCCPQSSFLLFTFPLLRNLFPSFATFATSFGTSSSSKLLPLRSFLSFTGASCSPELPPLHRSFLPFTGASSPSPELPPLHRSFLPFTGASSPSPELPLLQKTFPFA
ncbi:hypothetical protein BJ322DRAFT_1110448 [Thelephora terrestris]|uniref:Uncharacterized protein n=1 Tax=Thelephora terrestris TaxID=56493 RepID=A0A9P6HDT3_9AGAM|nr:hypothetical protein BJ322DRAFT_1110448 [Thelephora terrestris]